MNDVEIGTRLTACRGDVSQREIAARMRTRGHKWSHVTVGAVERGQRPLRVTEAVDIAELLDTSPLRIMMGAPVTNELSQQLAAANRRLRAIDKALRDG